MDIGKDLQRAYDDGYKDGKQDAMKWIPVSERLPDFEGAVLCLRKSKVRNGIRYQEILYFNFDEQWFEEMFTSVFVEDGCVTHWIPLPEPPEEDIENG